MALKLNNALRSALIEHLNSHFFTQLDVRTGAMPDFDEAPTGGRVGVGPIPNVTWDTATNGTAALSGTFMVGPELAGSGTVGYGMLGTSSAHIYGSAGSSHAANDFHLNKGTYGEEYVYFLATTAVYPGE